MVKPRIIKGMKSQWKPVPYTTTGLSSSDPADDFSGLVGFEELTDYAFVGGKLKKKNSATSNGKGKTATEKKSKLKAQHVENASALPKQPKLKVGRGNDTASNGKVLKRKSNESCGLTDETTIKKKKYKKKKKKVKTTDESTEIGIVEDKSHEKKKKKKKKKTKTDNISSENRKEPVSNGLVTKDDQEDTMSDEVLVRMASWSGLGVPSVLLRALDEKSFTSPTKIQTMTLPAAIFGRRDILGAAETGSGKTLAFGLPILNGILQEMEKNENQLEIVDNKNEDIIEDEEVDEGIENNSDASDLSDHDGNESETDTPDFVGDEDDKSDLEGSVSDFSGDYVEGTTDCVKVIEDVPDFPSICESKSKSRYIPKPLYALILTPTRELAVQISQHLKAAAKYTTISVAVVVGGLAAQKQERLLNRGPEIVVGTPGRLWELIDQGHPHLAQIDKLKYLAVDETDRMLEKGHFEELERILEGINKDDESTKKRQNFVFSATLTLTHEAPRYVLQKRQKKRRGKSGNMTSAQKLASIMETIGLTDPKIVDITEGSGVADLLQEAQIICPMNEKDFYLYYFLQRHPGRTLVFCNSIEAVRRLSQLFTLLQCSALPLHAKMNQRQRLKNLERFRDNPRGVLLATDVAARGLDIPNVQHVIHYQTPRTAESYVHRSGRTARAKQEGLTVLFVEPSEVSNFSRIFRTLGRDSNLPIFPVEAIWLAAVKERVHLARRLDVAELHARRVNKEQSWFDKLVKDMDMEVSDDELPTSYSRESAEGMKKEATALRKQFADLLTKPLLPRGATHKSKLVVPLCPGSIPRTKDMYQENAVAALKSSIEEEKALKRKLNNERSKERAQRRKVAKLEAIEKGKNQQPDSEGSDVEESDS